MSLWSARNSVRTLRRSLTVSNQATSHALNVILSSSAADEHTEELLSIHEEEIKRLKEERRMKGPLLASIRKYFDICDDEKELLAAASDQSRLLGRGPRDPGRLLREEKMRKRVTKEKPRVSSFRSSSHVTAKLTSAIAGARPPGINPRMGG